jgi:UDP-2,3-diacylglucosamine pyrophosphatase LpxH
MKRKLPLVIISDTHLGSYGCHAEELLQYLKSINPKTLVLNGDIIDIWSFSKSYFPDAHTNVLRQIIKMSTNGTEVIYITGNHDEALRKYSDFNLGMFKLVDKAVLDVDGEKIWIFHGDVFDNSVKGFAKIFAKIGGKGYDLLILINAFINWILVFFGKEKKSFSKIVKNSIKTAVSFINNFEETITEIAIENGYKFVACGHIHDPKIKFVTTKNGSTTYLNSGDWIENLTALEYNKKKWTIYKYNSLDFIKTENSN